MVEQQLGLEQHRSTGRNRAEPAREREAARKEGGSGRLVRKVGSISGGSGPKSPIVPRRMPAPTRIPQVPKTRIVPAIMSKPAASPHEPPTARIPRRMAAPISLPTSPPIRIVPSVIPRLLPR